MDKFVRILKSWNIDIDDQKRNLFDQYYRLLVSWNDRVNLTSITDREEIYIKHFADSIALLHKQDLSGKTVLDVGSGAGFPGVPIGIMCPSCDIVLVDSLNKRINFLNEVIGSLGLKKVCAVHGRAEDLARDFKYRESFDVVTSRAVANMSVLAEYCLPFVKVGGLFVSYKSGNIEEELEASDNAIGSLGGSLIRFEKYSIPETDYMRSLVYIYKDNNTDNRYPRKAGLPSKKPL